jgi:hypothetical protein
VVVPVGSPLLVTGAAFRDRHSVTRVMSPDLVRHIVVNRAGVRFLFRYAEFRQHFEDLVRWNFELPGQLVYADFLHRI